MGAVMAKKKPTKTPPKIGVQRAKQQLPEQLKNGVQIPTVVDLPPVTEQGPGEDDGLVALPQPGSPYVAAYGCPGKKPELVLYVILKTGYSKATPGAINAGRGLP